MLRRIPDRFETKMFNSTTSLKDYLRKIILKVLSMQAKFHGAAAYSKAHDDIVGIEAAEGHYDVDLEYKKKGSLVICRSVTSTAPVDRGDPMKKRGVERSRKMTEAKERNSTPAIPSDMQSVMKRYENLEKEVRSLKLNLSFTNGKDPEQTKWIKEMQVQNGELGEEKERLLDEIRRIIYIQEETEPRLDFNPCKKSTESSSG